MSVVSPTSMFHPSITDQHPPPVPAAPSDVSSVPRAEDLSPQPSLEQPPTVSELVPQSAVTPPGRYVGGPDTETISSPSSQGPKKSSVKSIKSSGWKTSKFFSKSMSSCEILRGLKKLSLSSSVEEAEGKVLDVKSLRQRLSSLRKRSSYSNEEVRVVGVDSDSRPPSLTDSSCSPKSSQDEGIVCKKEDILSIISEACKKKPSPSSAKRLPLRQTLSASFETSIEVIRARKEPMRRTGSEEYHPRKNLSADSDEQSPMQDASCEVFEEKDPLQAKSPQKTNPPEEVRPTEDPEWSTVKWDESDVVDAVLLGDAIESFLKVSMSSGEKRVSFRKS